MVAQDLAVMFGAVYFRKSNPPREDWERDYRVAAEDGHRLFRHWFPWGAIEVAPGQFDWEDYDRHLDLAAEHGIRTIIAEISDAFPEWLYHQFPQARRENRNGVKRTSRMHVSCVTGGAHSMCLDNPEVSERAGRFLTELAARYRGHPGLYGYDVWNECSLYSPDLICYCPATQARFREWLKKKRNDLAALARAWHRYSYTSWDEVELPRHIEPYPDVLDAIEFQVENAFRWMHWRIEVIRAADPDHLITAHGNAKSFSDIAPACGDDWRAAEHVDVFGYTYWHANRCGPFLAGDMIRGASRGKPFWRAEAVGDSCWDGRRVGAPAPGRDAMHDPANIRLDAMISLVVGARAYQTPRWRPLLDGPLFGAYGWYGMDGGRTDRSDMIASIARWVGDERLTDLWAAGPVRGEIAVLVCEEAQAHCYASQGSTEAYSLSVQGAYNAFYDSNIQCDFVKLDQIGHHDLLYVPFPVALSDATVETLKEWVRSGGCMMAEGCFGYFNDRAHAFPRQPSRGFDEVFGCVEESVSFAPDRWEDLEILLRPGRARAALFRQAYCPDGGAAVGWYDDGAVAVVDNSYGGGRTRLVGSMPGHAYRVRPAEESRQWLAGVLGHAGKRPMVAVSEKGVIARLWRDAERWFLWVVNMGPEDRSVTVDVAGAGITPAGVEVLRGGDEVAVDGACLRLAARGRDAAVLRLT